MQSWEHKDIIHNDALEKIRGINEILKLSVTLHLISIWECIQPSRVDHNTTSERFIIPMQGHISLRSLGKFAFVYSAIDLHLLLPKLLLPQKESHLALILPLHLSLSSET